MQEAHRHIGDPASPAFRRLTAFAGRTAPHQLASSVDKLRAEMRGLALHTGVGFAALWHEMLTNDETCCPVELRPAFLQLLHRLAKDDPALQTVATHGGDEDLPAGLPNC